MTDPKPCARSLDSTSSELLSYSRLLLPHLNLNVMPGPKDGLGGSLIPFIRSSSQCGHNKQTPSLLLSITFLLSGGPRAGGQALFFRASLGQVLTLRTLVTRKLKAATALDWAVLEQESQERMLSFSRLPDKELGTQVQSCL